jgi:prepilin-type N-terminal cleavage/methylation domain-containing protein/prepilin-type processing-associated H-X9-DG protein
MKTPCSAFFGASPVGGRNRAFTLIELMVVTVVLVLLAALAIPAHGKAGKRGQAVLCAQNLRQLMAGYLMYAQDNNDVALGASSSAIAPAWCSGGLFGPPQAIDEAIIRQSPTYPYVGSTTVFRCPDDMSGFIVRGKFWLRNRSYAVNGFMGAPSAIVYPNADLFKSARTLSDITAPGPSEVYVLIEEHENSLNDSHFLPFRDLHSFGNQQWLDAPSGRHDNGAGLGYADGHANIHRWRDSDVQATWGPPTPWAVGRLPRPGPRDFDWFTNHIAAFKDLNN